MSVFYLYKPYPNMTVWDGLVYLVGDMTNSVIAQVGAPESKEMHMGQTSSLNGEMISEVYVNPMSAYGVAATVYHELLHNKFQMQIDIHRTADGLHQRDSSLFR